MIDHLLNQSVTIATRATVGNGGLNTYNSATTYAARVEPSRKKVLTPDGRELVSSAKVFLSASVVVNTTDRITLPDASTPEILDVKPNYDGDGVNQFVVVIV
jgi:hypothetical protein